MPATTERKAMAVASEDPVADQQRQGDRGPDARGRAVTAAVETVSRTAPRSVIRVDVGISLRRSGDSRSTIHAVVLA